MRPHVLKSARDAIDNGVAIRFHYYLAIVTLRFRFVLHANEAPTEVRSEAGLSIQIVSTPTSYLKNSNLIDLYASSLWIFEL